MRIGFGQAARLDDVFSTAGEATVSVQPMSDRRLTLVAALAALPCGYGIGIVVAYLLAGGPEIGRLPLMTVPLALLATAAFALMPLIDAQTRFMVMTVGAIAATVLALMVWLGFP